MSATTTSPYLSRSDTEPALVRRREPVVWGSVDDGPLDEAQLDVYDREGFLSFDELLDEAQRVAVDAELDRLRADARRNHDERWVVEPGSDEVRSVFEVHRLSETIAALAASDRLAAVARQLLGSEVYLHQSRVNFKPGFRGREFYWHSDFETWHLEDGMPAMRAVSLAVSLTENRSDNGSLMIVPGSHRSFVGCVGATPDDNYRTSLRRQDLGVPSDAALSALVEVCGVRTVTGPPGSGVYFDSNCMHGSNGNITPFPRRNLFLVYNSTENALVPPFGGTAPRPGFIASRTVEPLPT